MQNLKKLRKNRGVTQQEMADYLGLSRAAYTNIENGKRETDFTSINKLANYFDVSIDYLFGKTDNPRSTLEVSKKEPTLAEAEEALKLFVENKLGREPDENELSLIEAAADGLIERLKKQRQ